MIETQEFTLNHFPSTRYQGSKRKILPWLRSYFDELNFHTVLDAFGGTGAVSYLFKLMGKEVTYNDELKFNSIIGKALIENSKVQLSEEEIGIIAKPDHIIPAVQFVRNNFTDIYFTDEENLWIDKFMHNLMKLHGGTMQEVEYKRSIAMFSLFQASMTKRPYNLFHRKNLYMRMNEVDRNFGNKTTWEKPFNVQVDKFSREANKAIFDNHRHCRALNESAFNLENESYDLVYIDPPYVDHQGDNDTMDYLYCYHFLEGISNYEDWKDFIDYESKNLRFRKEFHSKQFTKYNVVESFKHLFSVFQESIIVVSYKKNGLPTIETIVDLLQSVKPNVKIFSKHYIYALNKQNGDAKNNREVLLIGY